MSKLDVLFVHPNGAPIIYQELSKTYSAIEPPIWAALMANNARKNGWSTQLMDCEAERLNAAQSADAIDTRLIRDWWLSLFTASSPLLPLKTWQARMPFWRS